VLNGFENVSKDARLRVSEAVRDLGYVPHAGARSLSLARTNAIGVVLPDLHGEFFSEIVRGMDREASERGYLLLLSNLHARPEQAAHALRAMNGRVDGLIVMAPHLSAQALGAALPPAIPSILINTRKGGLERPAIHLDNAAGVRAVVEHLVARGRSRLVHIAGPSGNVDADERSQAFGDSCAALGVEWLVMRGDFEEDSGNRAVLELLDRGQDFDAVFAANDNMAIGALLALRSRAVAVPNKVAVAGFDDIPLARHLGLTTVRVRIDELGQRAVSRLLEIVGTGETDGDELHAPELVIRPTTDPNGRS
jgi:LacI family transcriptional regulator